MDDLLSSWKRSRDWAGRADMTQTGTAPASCTVTLARLSPLAVSSATSLTWFRPLTTGCLLLSEHVH